MSLANEWTFNDLRGTIQLSGKCEGLQSPALLVAAKKGLSTAEREAADSHVAVEYLTRNWADMHCFQAHNVFLMP